MVSKVLNGKGKLHLSVANKLCPSVRCASLTWMEQGPPCITPMRIDCSCHSQGADWYSRACLPLWDLPVLYFYVQFFSLELQILLNGLTKADGDELEFLVGLTILILCHSYNRHMNQIYLH